MKFEKAFALRLKELLQEKNTSIEELAAASGESVEKVKKLLNAEIPLDDIKELVYAMQDYREDNIK